MQYGRPEPSATGERAISPVIGVVVLVAITVLLVSAGAAFVFGLTDSPQPVPETDVAFQYDDSTDTVTLEVKAIDTVTDQNTERLVLVVDGANGTARKTWATEGSGGVVNLESDDVAAGQTLTVDDASGSDTGDVTLSFELQQGDELRLVWHAPEDDRTATLATDTVPVLDDSGDSDDSDDSGGSSPSASLFDKDSTVVTDTGGVTGDGESSFDISTGGAQVLGNTNDVDGDGRAELPYVDSSGNLKINDSSGEIQTLVDENSISNTKAPDTDKSLMATGTWDGSPKSVFYANEGHTRIYRVQPGGSPTLVADLSGNGVNSVLGPGDIDGDGTEELVYAGGSQTVRYVEPSGATKTTGLTSGLNVGIGSGPLVDIDGDGTDSAVVVDGSNDVRLVESSGATSTPAQSSVSAAKTPATAADVDDDGSLEIVYVDASSANLKYIDDLDGSPSVEPLEDDNGNTISADEETGVVS